MRIFKLEQPFNKHGESDWAMFYHDEHDRDRPHIDWFAVDGTVVVSRPIQVSVSDDMPIPDIAFLNDRVVVCDPQSDRLKKLLGNSMIQFIPLDVSSLFDEDEIEQIPNSKGPKGLCPVLIHAINKCRLAPGTAVEMIGPDERRVWFEVDNLSLFESEIERQTIRRYSFNVREGNAFWW